MKKVAKKAVKKVAKKAAKKVKKAIKKQPNVVVAVGSGNVVAKKAPKKKKY